MNKTADDKKIPTVAIIGRPNVGKSTLFNRLTGKRDALVDKTPGLTRDRRHAIVELRDHPVEIIDTAGIESSSDTPDVLGLRAKEQTKLAIEQADCLCLLFDAKAGLQPGDLDIVELARKSFKPWIAVVNKVESGNIKAAALEFYETGIAEFTLISAKSGSGLEELKDRLLGLWRSYADKETKKGNGHEFSQGEAIRVCLVGRPNVGKSSIMNQLVGQDRMLVSNIPGTTRDSIDCLLQRQQGKDIIFVDTAGIRKRSKVKHRVEKFSVLKAIESMRTAHICICVFDASEGITEQDRRLAGYTREYAKGCITVFNKWDLVKEDGKLRKFLSDEAKIMKKMMPYAPHLNISAITGKNIKKLLSLIDQVYSDFSSKETTGRLNRILKQALLRRNPPVTKGHFLKLFYVTQTDTRPPVLTFFANYPHLFPEHYRRFLENFFRQELDIPYTPIKIILKER